MKCPNCGYEVPKPPTPPYEYNGWLKPYLPLVLKTLRAGQAPREVKKTLLALHGRIYRDHLIVPTIEYIRRRYGIELRASTPVDSNERNREITTRYRTEKITLAQLGREFGLSRERIRGIIAVFERKETRRKAEQEIIQAAGRIEDVSLRNLFLSCRIQNCFANEGLQTVGDVMKLSDIELLRIPNFWRHSLREWKKVLQHLQAAHRSAPVEVEIPAWPEATP